MGRPTAWLWLVAAVLTLAALALGIGGLASTGATAHASDVYRDDVLIPFQKLIDAGAVDLEKAASALGLQSNGSADFRIGLALTDDVVRRVERKWSGDGHRLCTFAVMNLLCAIAVGVQARRLRTP